MIYWNPLYRVSLSDQSILFEDERGSFSLRKPSSMKTWGIFNRLEYGLPSSEIVKINHLERALLTLLSKRKLIAEFSTTSDLFNCERNAGHYLTFDKSPIAALERLRSATVCILGVGGIGSVVLQHLVALGVRNYVLVDGDKVEASNLNRQLIFSPIDIGSPKVDCAKKFILSRTPNSHVVTFSCQVNSIKDLEKLPLETSNIIVHCLDTPRETIDDIVYSYGYLKKIAVITAGVGVYYGHWGPLVSPEKNNLTYQDWAQQNLTAENTSEKKTREPTRWSFGPTNTLIGASLTLEVVEWLGGRRNINSLNTRLVQRFSDNQIIAYKAT